MRTDKYGQQRDRHGIPPRTLLLYEILRNMNDSNGTSYSPTESASMTRTNSLDTSTANTLPPDHPLRTLVLCFDGTGDQFDADNSNIVEFFSMLKKDDPGKQLVYYQAGIGTYTTPQIATPLASKISKNLDMAVAWNLDAHIMGGYEFLMQNYQVNDRICIFGFSRGAYTARCLAGMIHKVGLLPACNHQQVPFAYKMYTSADDEGWKQSNAFKRTFSNAVDIEFLGVWDTVNAVGLIPRRLPFTTSNTVVKTFRHAVALDERRAKFKANLWNRPTSNEEILSVTDRKAQQAGEKPKSHTGSHNNGKGTLRALEHKYTKDKNAATNIDEVWFAGCHCDVGGGSVGNGVQTCLARIPLRWMVRECFRTNSGILFHIDGLKKIGLDPSALYPVVLPRPPALPLDPSSTETSIIQSIPKEEPPPIYDDDEMHIDDLPQESEEMLDLKDSLAPIYDQLNLAWFWWILEYIPFRNRFQKSDNKWTTESKMNRGHGRYIPRQQTRGVRIHRSVKTRMEAKHADGSVYKPKIENLDMSRVTWVD
ncbi:hypothetical protein M413DRAFT_438988 [Hebeloma cylindrosporum]|uniref:T6SS Phospholipase effector Tle1-like catalytic domain-containing protein n=1 Tax=Hebeloma cylindrosporum TaxID=76867 RepID=A0A0C3D0B4_HEBCY|nr:hypothetical protein M413DRAFT_438988 [Hebeloma cylindrosporum h7]